MVVETMVEAAVAEIKQNLTRFCEALDLSKLTPEVAERMSVGLQQALASAGVASYRAFLVAYETEEAVVRDAHGEVYRFKKKRNRAYLTPFGKLELQRR